MTTIIIIANIISLIGCGLMVLVGFLKEKKKILLTQCVQFGIMGISNMMLGGITGLVSNVISIVRNMYTFKKNLTIPVKLAFLVLQAGITVISNTQGLLGWLPFFAAGSLTWFMDTKKEITLKCVIIFGQILWIIYDLYLLNYVSSAFDLAAVISNGIGILWILKGKKKK